jgi:predicted MFS family arabinose efflux permease
VRIDRSLPAAGDGLFNTQFKVLLLVQLAFGFAFATFFLLPKFLTQTLGASPSAVGLVSATFGVPGFCAMPWVGRALDAGRSRALILCGCALMAVSALGFSAVTQVGVLACALRFAQGLAMTMVVNGGSLLVSRSAPPRRLAEALGIFAGASLVMNALAPVIAERVAKRFGYGLSFWLAAACAALAFGCALRLRELPAIHAPVQSSFSQVALRKSSLRMGAILILAGVGFGMMFTFSAPFSLTLGIEDIGGFFVAFAGSAVFVRLSLGRAMDSIGHRRVAFASLAAYGALVASMWQLAAGRLELIGGLFGFAHGLFVPAFTAFMLHVTQAHERGRVLTLFHGFFGAGHATVMLLGIFVERFGYRPVFAVTGLLISLVPLLMLDWPLDARPEANVT